MKKRKYKLLYKKIDNINKNIMSFYKRIADNLFLFNSFLYFFPHLDHRIHLP